MSFTKQAKNLSKPQQEAVLVYLCSKRYPVREHVIFLLSVRVGLRASEIAALKLEMITDAEDELSEVIALTNEAAKGKRGGRAIPIAKDLKAALVALKA